MTPTATLIGTAEPGTPEWHAMRAGRRIGGSEIAAVLGLSPWESRFSLWHRKAGHIGPVEETPEMEWGKRLEDAVATKFSDTHPDLTEAANGTWLNTQRPYQLANPDRLFTTSDGHTIVLEVKTSPMGDGWGPDGSDEVPVYYRTQLLWYLDTLGLDVGWLVVLISGCEYREYRVERHEADCALMRQAAEEFIASLDAGERPDIDAHSATYQAIRELHPDIDGTDVELPNDLALRFLNARADLAAAEAEEQHARSLVCDHMGTAKTATWDGRTIARRQARGTGNPYLVAAKNLPIPEEPTARSAA